MKYPFTLLALVLFCYTSCSSSKSGWEVFDLKGKVSSFSETIFSASLEKTNGWMKEQETIAGPNIFQFSEHGDYLGMEQYQDGELWQTSTTQMENGKIKSWRVVDADGVLVSEQKILTETSRYREMEMYDEAGNLQSRHKHQLRNGLMIAEEIIFYRPNGEVEFEQQSNYQHNSAGLMTGFTQNISFDDQLRNYAVEYLAFDETGNWTEKIIYRLGQENMRTSSGQYFEREIEYYE